MCTGICRELQGRLREALSEGKLREAAGIAATGLAVMLGVTDAGSVGEQDRGTNGDVRKADKSGKK